MRIIITGATGNIGTELVRQCLLSSSITHVTILGRREPTTLDLTNSKLNFIKHTDFLQYPPTLLDTLRSQGIEGCIWCLGASSGRVSNRNELETINKDYPIAAAKAFKTLSSNFRFIYTSLLGADPSSWWTVAAVRVQAEAELLGIEGIDGFIVRPGAVEAGKRDNPTLTERIGVWMMPFFRICMPSLHIYGDVLGKGYIGVVTRGMEGVKSVLGKETRTLTSKEIKMVGMAEKTE